jgi:hypothetical protein
VIRRLLAGLALAVPLLALPAGGAEKAPKMPREREPSYLYDLFDHSLVRPVTRTLDPALLVRKLTGRHREAENVDETDQVRLPSTWWQPRIGFRPVSVEQMLAGPGDGKGPAPGRWTVTKAKVQGVTPGFNIEDSAGGRFVIKFDPPGFPDLSTACDVIGSYLFWAAGYNVPENTITIFHADSLDIDDEATYLDALGREQRFTREHLDAILARVARLRDGRYRAGASRFLSGKPLGPFQYNGRRRDDDEDRIPHEHRRELRGLWTMAAWTNHADVRGANSLDTWVEEGGRAFVRHHLLDFSAILGAGPFGPRSGVAGTEYYVDANVMLREIASLGLAPFAWERAVDPRIPSVGRVDAWSFDPVGWRPDYPNPAFDERTTRDIRWGARIVAGFTDDHIRAAVRKGQYTDPRAATYVSNVLIERRDRLVRAWLLNPETRKAP